MCNLILDSKIIKVYHEGIQSVITLVQGLSTQISDLSQTVEKQSNKTSKNSSLPPSTDGFKKTNSLREPSTQKPGGPVGHKGLTLKIVEYPVTW